MPRYTQPTINSRRRGSNRDSLIEETQRQLESLGERHGMIIDRRRRMLERRLEELRPSGQELRPNEAIHWSRYTSGGLSPGGWISDEFVSWQQEYPTTQERSQQETEQQAAYRRLLVESRRRLLEERLRNEEYLFSQGSHEETQSVYDFLSGRQRRQRRQESNPLTDQVTFAETPQPGDKKITLAFRRVNYRHPLAIQKGQDFTYNLTLSVKI